MSQAIALSGIVKTFGPTRALDALDLDVAAGEVHGFLGPNGAGKTTTIRVLLGLMRADAGDARLLGGDPWRDAVALRRRLAYVPGDVSLWPKLTGGEVIDLLGRLRGDLDPRRRNELLDRFELDPTKRARTYSKGNRQKVALVAALASSAELLILDEPTSGLDPLMEAEFQACIREVKGEGRTVLLSSHILAEVEALCDRVSIIRDGRRVEAGSLSELRHLTRTSITAETSEVATILVVAAQDVPATGSVVFGLGFLAVGLAFTGLAALSAQVSENTRVASGLAGATVGLAFVLRAAGDIGDGTLSWLSPIGWAQKARPFAGEQWWPLVLPAAFAAGCLAAAVALAARRDLGGGLFPARPGPAVGGPGLASPLGLALQLQRGSLVWWSAGLLVLGVVYGSVANDVEDFLADNDALRDVLARSGTNLIDSFFGTTMLILAIVGSGFGLQAAQRLRSEESALRAEPLLAAPCIPAPLDGQPPHPGPGRQRRRARRRRPGHRALLRHCHPRPGEPAAAVGRRPGLPACGRRAHHRGRRAGQPVASPGVRALGVAGVQPGRRVPRGGSEPSLVDDGGVTLRAHAARPGGAPHRVAPLLTLSAVAAGFTLAGDYAFRHRDIG